MKYRKRKDYIRLFITYCKDNELWFSVFADGNVDEIVHPDSGVYYDALVGLKFGSKAAYDWLIQEKGGE